MNFVGTERQPNVSQTCVTERPLINVKRRTIVDNQTLGYWVLV